MKNRFGIKTLVCFLCMVLPCLNIQSQTETDYDGNIYPIVTIGNQVWMAENLRTTHYSDGSAIEDERAFDFYPYEVAMAGSDTTKYFFYYNNDSIYADEYGCLYNWFAAVNGNISSNSDPGSVPGVCPAGWHIPSLTEWEELENYAGEENKISVRDFDKGLYLVTITTDKDTFTCKLIIE